MKQFYILLILIFAISITAYSQVDTLEAIEIGIIQVPDSITQLYVQDLNGDSLKELIICTQNHVYVYNQTDNVPIWTSPELVRPTDLQFADVDGDGLLDVSVKDSASISIFDVFSSSLIYTMAVDSLYRCYAIGDANMDSTNDLLIARQEPFDYDTRPDTVWLTLLYGPNFTNSISYSIAITCYEYQNSQAQDSFRQIVNRVILAQLGGGSIHYPMICLTTDINRSLVIYSAHHADSKYYGSIWLINPQNFHIIYSDENLGKSESIEIQESPAGILINSILSNHRIVIQDLNYTYTRTYNIVRFNESGLADSLLTVAYGHSTQRDIPGWTFAIGDMNSNFDGSELCYDFMDSLKEISLLNGIGRWIYYLPDSAVSIAGVFKSNILFSSPEIIVKQINPSPQYLFINGNTPQINTILPNTIPSISNISDLNHDGNDEILCISGNTLHIYNLDWATSVKERPLLPGEYLTVANYPNPFNAQTIIKYNLPHASDINLKIYDILGREIVTFEKPNQPAGLGQITWDASDQTSGVYFYRLNAGTEQKTGRMVLLK